MFLRHSDPLRTKSFATMTNLSRTKTDATDAKIIAEYGFQCKPEPTRMEEDYQYKVEGFLKLIRFNQKHIAMNTNFLEALKYNGFKCGVVEQKEIVQGIIQRHKENNKKLEKKIEALLNENCKELHQRYRSIPGVGPMLAASLISFYGDFSEFSDAKKAAAFAGICPKINQSGSSVNKKVGISKRGNPTLRTIFYMASLSASVFNQSCKEKYQKMRAAGKPGKVALIAIANKILRQAMALASKGEFFNQNYEENRQLAIKNSLTFNTAHSVNASTTAILLHPFKCLIQIISVEHHFEQSICTHLRFVFWYNSAMRSSVTFRFHRIIAEVACWNSIRQSLRHYAFHTIED